MPVGDGEGAGRGRSRVGLPRKESSCWDLEGSEGEGFKGWELARS